MDDLKLYFAQELPLVNAALDLEINDFHPFVLPIAQHVINSGGKRLRPLLTILFARCLDYEKKDIYALAISIELLHCATLIHDDILDQAELRRGGKAAHLVFGTNQAVLGGDVLLAKANSIVARYKNYAMSHCISEALMATATGEIAEIAMVRSPDFSLQSYMDIITGKTAYLIQASCTLGALAGQGSDIQVKAATDFGLNLGIAFQLVDDALDYSSDQDTSGKPQGGDLREGKVTLPLILYLQELAENKRKQLIADINHNKLDDDYISDIVHDINRMDLPEKTRDKAAHYLDLAKDSLKNFKDCQQKNILYKMIDYVLQRNK